jgi:D-alanine-D-alanine ligase
LSDTVARACADAAKTAHSILGLRDLSRSDLIVDADGVPWFLEVNVAPGMTETSLVPLAIEQSGRKLGAVMAELVARAQAR